MMRRRDGYLLFEAIVAIAVLSVGVLGVNAAFRQALLTRAIADDYTRAAFLLDRVIAPLTLQPVLAVGGDQGDFGRDEALRRFRWRTEVERVEVPLPELPPQLQENYREQVERETASLARITATVTWTRAGSTYERTAATLFPGNRLWAPKPEEDE
jgi:hypothetical protein